MSGCKFFEVYLRAGSFMKWEEIQSTRKSSFHVYITCFILYKNCTE